MTDLTDLVKRLREANRAYRFVPECGEAADAIEALEAERDKYKHIAEELRDVLAKREADLAAARAALDRVDRMLSSLNYGTSSPVRRIIASAQAEGGE